ncbi:30S ribosomal protein S7 [Candidatus Woesearchaeota archaeon]|nr:30S ribosomal protein S7 [Candidatus Woesearchaeota archaeon]
MVLAFNRWDVSGIAVADFGLKKYIALEPRFAPKTGGRYAGNRFYKSKIFIVERLINKLLVPGHKAKKHFKTSGRNTGMTLNAYAMVERVLERLEKVTKKNPVEVFVQALENASQREEILTIEYGGARYPKAVECAPQRRIDLALRNMVQGAYHKNFGEKSTMEEALTKEILAAYNSLPESNAIAKKLEVERQCDSAR